MSQKLKTCLFLKDCIYCLRHLIQMWKLTVSTKAADVIRQLQLHTSDWTQDVLRPLNVFWQPVGSFGHKAAQLNSKLVKLVKFHRFLLRQLSKTETEALERLQQRLLSWMIIASPRPNRRHTLDTSKCDKQVGCILLQEQPRGPANPISYCSRPLNKAEQTYETIQSGFLLSCFLSCS